MKTLPITRPGKITNSTALTKLVAAQRKYGVTERKKAELDALALKVLDAQQQVDQFQAIVTALTTKLNSFQQQLVIDDASRSSALNNKNLVDQLVQSCLDLQTNAGIASTEMANADVLTNTLAVSVKVVVNKLIYSAEMINKLAANVTRKKALNPLISDELVSMLATAGTDANNAVALSLVALQTALAAQATNKESEAAVQLTNVQARDLYQFISGTKEVPGISAEIPAPSEAPLQAQLHAAYTASVRRYHEMQRAVKITTDELNDAQLSLNSALVNLQSLQAGLAAGNAAAMAS